MDRNLKYRRASRSSTKPYSIAEKNQPRRRIYSCSTNGILIEGSFEEDRAWENQELLTPFYRKLARRCQRVVESAGYYNPKNRKRYELAGIDEGILVDLKDMLDDGCFGCYKNDRHYSIFDGAITWCRFGRNSQGHNDLECLLEFIVLFVTAGMQIGRMIKDDDLYRDGLYILNSGNFTPPSILPKEHRRYLEIKNARSSLMSRVSRHPYSRVELNLKGRRIYRCITNGILIKGSFEEDRAWENQELLTPFYRKLARRCQRVVESAGYYNPKNRKRYELAGIDEGILVDLKEMLDDGCFGCDSNDRDYSDFDGALTWSRFGRVSDAHNHLECLLEFIVVFVSAGMMIATMIQDDDLYTDGMDILDSGHFRPVSSLPNDYRRYYEIKRLDY